MSVGLPALNNSEMAVVYHNYVKPISYCLGILTTSFLPARNESCLWFSCHTTFLCRWYPLHLASQVLTLQSTYIAVSHRVERSISTIMVPVDPSLARSIADEMMKTMVLDLCTNVRFATKSGCF